MIIWLASYPKSGNTWIRSFLSAYYYTDDGLFDFSLLDNIEQYPNRSFFEHKIEQPGEISNYWSSSQEKILSYKKIKFLKTHNSLISINNNSFTTSKFTLGAVYIVRDPRNVLTSLKNHFSLNYEDALEFMKNKKKYIYDNRTGKENDFSTFHFLSSWSNHYKSWTKTKLFPMYIIKYENLIKNTNQVFEKLIIFINNISGIEKNIDSKKFENSIQSTSFDKLQNLESKSEFTENVFSKSKSKIKFFFLGPKNNWKDKLTEDIKSKANDEFAEDIKDLNYN